MLINYLRTQFSVNLNATSCEDSSYFRKNIISVLLTVSKFFFAIYLLYSEEDTCKDILCKYIV